MKKMFENLCLEDIEQMIAERKEENVSLEFKTITRSDFTNKDDKRNLAKALSGFSNSCGGIVIWGVEAKRNEDGVDGACRLCPFNDGKIVESKLNNLTGEATSPVLDLVQHRLIPAGNDTHIAVTYVPEYSNGPVMAKLGEHRYYKRSGDSFYKMEHFDIADMFGKRHRPKLKLSIRKIRSYEKYSVLLQLENTGRASAKFPFVGFNCPKPLNVDPYGLDGNRNHDFRKLLVQTDKYENHLIGCDGLVLHPGMIVGVEKLIISRETNSQDIPSHVFLEYCLAAENHRLFEDKLEINLTEL